jgi:hypothetical protein
MPRPAPQVVTTFDYSGARVLVTGGSNGIGLGVARAFHTAGAHVTITGKRGSAGEYDHDLSGLDYRPCRLPIPTPWPPWPGRSTASTYS